MDSPFQYLSNIATWLTVGYNVILGGDPRETMSSRMGKGQENGCYFCGWVCEWLDVFELGHCAKAIQRHVGDMQVQHFENLTAIVLAAVTLCALISFELFVMLM